MALPSTHPVLYLSNGPQMLETFLHDRISAWAFSSARNALSPCPHGELPFSLQDPTDSAPRKRSQACFSSVDDFLLLCALLLAGTSVGALFTL